MSDKSQSPTDKWSLFRFSVVGGLLANPPAKGELNRELEELASRSYVHPVDGSMTTFGVSTIERWYYKALRTEDPIAALGRKVRSDIGKSKAMCSRMLQILGIQYNTYPHWSFKLHADNLKVEVENLEDIGESPSYATVKRRMQERGWFKKRSKKPNQTSGQKRAAKRLEEWEVRSFEAEHVHQLWHLDFHEGSRRIVDSKGEWHTPKVLCILDDRSRLCCHIQWYLNETADVLFHGLSQAFHKRGLPRALMTDNGSAMIAHETRNGLLKLGINHEKTLPYSPYQNGKQESFWGNLEGRLLAMLTRVESLTLDYLNLTTQAWVEMEYNKSKHAEIGISPVRCMLQGPDVSRSAPAQDALKRAFTIRESRKQRRSDGTISVSGVRFEIPSRFNHMMQLSVCFASWDKSAAFLVDQRTGDFLATIYPQDKAKNASGKRRIKDLPEEIRSPDLIDPQIEPPLLRKLLSDYAETGLPPAFIPKD